MKRALHIDVSGLCLTLDTRHICRVDSCEIGLHAWPRELGKSEVDRVTVREALKRPVPRAGTHRLYATANRQNSIMSGGRRGGLI